MLIPDGVEIEEALEPLRRDIQILEKSILAFDSFSNRLIRFPSLISLLPADLPQLSANCRHGGTASKSNCPTCFAEISSRLEPDSISERRSDRAIDTMIDFVMNILDYANLSDSAKGKIRQSCYNILIKASILAGCDVDIPRQSFRDGHHLFFAGLLKVMLNHILSLMNREQRNEFRIRLRDFSWPRHVLVCEINTKMNVGAAISQSLYRQLALAASWALDGLVATEIYCHFVDFYLWIADFFNPLGFSEITVKKAIQKGLEILENGSKLMPKVWDRPNGHSFLEVVLHDLPLLRNGNFSGTNHFELHHQTAKKFIIGHHKGELTAMHRFNVRDTLQFILHGSKWGPKREYKGGKDLLSIRDIRVSRMHQPHPLVSGMNTLSPPSGVYSGAGHWLPISFQWEKKRGKTPMLRSDPPTSSEIVAIKERFFKDSPELKLNFDNAKYYYPNGIQAVIDSRIVKIHVDDDVKVSYREEDSHNAPAFATVDKFLKIEIDGQSWLMFFPVWYWTKLYRKKIVCHSIRKTIQVERKQMEESDFMQPFFVSDILEQVMILHDCLRCTQHLASQCHCKNVCKSVLTCKKHNIPNCGECGPSTKELRDIHSESNRTYNVYDKSHGFRPEFRLRLGNSVG
jgi:hypothetical protein